MNCEKRLILPGNLPRNQSNVEENKSGGIKGKEKAIEKRSKKAGAISFGEDNYKFKCL